MPKIRIKYFGPIKNGFESEDGFMDIEKVTVFIGNQGSGKSSIAKLISTLSWIEKSLVRGDVKESEITRKSNFENKFCAYQNIKNYFDRTGRTEINYKGRAYSFKYANKTLEVFKNPTNGFLVPKIMYVPAERNFVSAVDKPSSLKKLPSTLYTFLEEFENAKQNLKDALPLPISNASFEYDKLNKISHIKGSDFKVRLSEASSGFQAFVPLFLVTRYLALSINKESDASQKELSIEEEKRIKQEIEKILSNKNLSEEVKKASLEILSARFKNACFLNIVEEIEQNLFPTSQRSVLNSLLEYSNLTKANGLILTTHSPYIINYLTLAIKGNSVLQKIRKSGKNGELRNKLNKIVPIDSCIASEDIVIYELSDYGEVKKLKNYEGIPSDENYLNLFLAETNQLFDALLEIEGISMNVNFFQANCQSNTTAMLFGICDNQDGSPAFIDIIHQTEWIAKIINNSAINVMLTAIDNCISIFRNNGTMESRCDAMLTYTDNIIFLELKNQRADWITDAINQIEMTIVSYIANNDITVYKHKRAFAANKKHPHFNYGNPERSQRFFNKYKIRLNIEATINI